MNWQMNERMNEQMNEQIVMLCRKRYLMVKIELLAQWYRGHIKE